MLKSQFRLRYFYIISINLMSKGNIKILGLLTLFLATITIVILLSPTQVSKLSYKGQTINITRNEYSIPFISAPSRKAFYYAQGCVTVEDRSFQISFRRLISEGRLSEYLGEQTLPLDKFMRQVGLSKWGERMGERLKRQNLQEYQTIQAYVDGMNECMAYQKTLPLDFHLSGIPWQNWTVVNVFKTYKLFEFSVSIGAFEEIFRTALLANHTKEEVDDLFPHTQQKWAFDSKTIYKLEDMADYLKSGNTKNAKSGNVAEQSNMQLLENLKVLQSFDLLKNAQGSNTWAISGKYTQSGKPILATDPHLGNSIPSNWYQFQGCYTNNNKRYCFSLFGILGAMFNLGKTDYMAVGPTVVYSDAIDFFKQKIENNQYFVDGEWRKLNERIEVIKVKTSKGIEQIHHIVLQTHRGPLVNYYFTQNGNFQIPSGLSMQWTGAYDDYTGFIDQTYLSEKSSIQELLEFSKSKVPKVLNSNIVFITADGHIASQRFGVYPIRKNPELGSFVKDGTTSQNDWVQYLPLEDRLSVIDPQCGYIVAANNRGAPREYYNNLLLNEIYTARADRITQMIEDRISKGIKFNAEITKQMQADTVDSYCQRILPTLLKVLPESFKHLKQFDCDFSNNSTIAPIYQIFFYELHQLIKKANFTSLSLLTQHGNYQRLYNFIKKAQNVTQNREILSKAWKNLLANPLLSFDALKKQTVPWGKIHQDVASHSPFGKHKLLSYFYNRVFEGSGNLHTVNVGKMGKLEFGNFDTSHRATNRAVYSFEGPSYWIIDSGASQRFYSKHYDDQWKLFKQNKYIQIKPHQSNSHNNQL